MNNNVDQVIGKYRQKTSLFYNQFERINDMQAHIIQDINEKVS